ncbi:hypothetical protein HGRIS_002732 [Hohenbuehelia grisea]|uniref:mannan endo-1,4-beta-mannosidase n=1 Tax=Hohenbuehelia grisea TaxID=104357 RepID=A0ABR3JMA5_9AGAR
MKLAASLVAIALAISPALADVSEWGQCGGNGWAGETKCATGLVCTVFNPWYSQCLKGTATSAPPTSTPKPSSTSQPPTSQPPSSSTSTTPVPTGYVKTSGTRFTLNGAKYTVVGANSYWIGLTGLSNADMNKAFSDIAKAGGTTVRTWGFNEVTTSSGHWNYYQLWNGATPTINSGATGLQNFDNVVAAAKANGLRLIVALTNNWSDYGGMDVYVKQILGSDNHDLFYTDSKVIAAFKNYVNTFVTRYKNDPTILGWELANEPRCRGSTGTSTGTCTPATITAWAKDISAYIKSIDSNHLVAIGDEGFYNQPGHASYPYQGGEGIDFDVNLGISTVDFGTVHAYPEHWGHSANPQAWGVQWIKDHAASMTTKNKPVIIEEYGVTTNQVPIYTDWLNNVVSSGLTGSLVWQAGSYLSAGTTHNDGYAVYPDGPVYPVLTAHAAALKARP